MKKVAAAAVVVVLVLAGAVWMLMPRGGVDPAAVGSEPAPSAPTRATPEVGVAPTVRRIPTTDDPDIYARAIAGVVFGMDTRRFGPGDYRDALMGEADPTLSASGRADLGRMLAERLPSAEQWARMRANDQWSEWVNVEIHVPGSWEQVVVSGQAEPGWAFRNVSGVQTTHYVEDGAARTASRERTVTIGMRCPADGAGVDRCRLNLVGINVIP